MMMSYLCAMARAAEEFAPSGSLRDSYYADTFPKLPEQRFFEVREPLARNDTIQSLVRTHLSLRSTEAFDVISYLNQADVPTPLIRGAKLGLVTGSAVYSGTEALGGDGWVVGSIGVGTGFLVGALTDVDWPPTFTARWGQDEPFSLAAGWLKKPLYLPRNTPLPAWHTAGQRSTAGAGLRYAPNDRLGFDAFLDPFATGGDTIGGMQMSYGF